MAVLDAHLEGGDVKSLVGSPKLRGPTGYHIKQVVQAIKALVAEFGDENFRAMVEQAIASQMETVRRRFGVRGAA